MIKILHFVDLPTPNPWLNGIAEHHDRTRFRHLAVSLGPRSELHAALEERGMQSFALNARSRRSYPQAIARLRRLLQREQIDILQTHLFEPSLLGLLAARLAKTPMTVLTRHHSDFTTLYRKPFHKWLDRRQALAADHVMAASHAVKKAMVELEGIPESRIEVAQYGYVFHKLRPMLTPEERGTLRHELGGDHRFLIATVSRLNIEKGHIYLLEALETIAAQHPNVLLLLVGAGPLEEDLRREVIQRGLQHHVRFLGWRNDAQRIIEAVDLMVHPTLHEAFCSVIIESLALERPLIATDVAAAGEQIDHGESGLLIPPRRPRAIAESVLSLIDNPQDRRRLGEEGRRRVTARFNFPRMMQHYESLYERWWEEKYPTRKPSGEDRPMSAAAPSIDAVSVIIPVRNEAAGITELLDRIAAQTRRPNEIVVTDGGSTDGTQHLIRQWQSKNDIPLTLIEEEHAYPGRGRNLAIGAAEHQWIASIDGGIQPPDNWLESLIATAEQHPQAQVIFGRYEPRIGSWFEECAAITYVGPDDRDRKFIANCLLHRDAWEQAGRFAEHLRSSEDLLFFRALEQCKIPIAWCRAEPVRWELQPGFLSTCRRFAVYSRHAMRAGLFFDWQFRVSLQYAVLMGLVIAGWMSSGWVWFIAAALLWLRSCRRIAAWNRSRPLRSRLLATLNLPRVLTVAAINTVIDVAMFAGVLRWLITDVICDWTLSSGVHEDPRSHVSDSPRSQASVWELDTGETSASRPQSRICPPPDRSPSATKTA